MLKQKTAYEMRISDWSSDVCSSDLHPQPARTGHDADEDAAVRLDLADHRLPLDRSDAGAGGRGDHDADGYPLRHQLLQRGRWRRPGAVPARVLVVWKCVV